MEKKKIIKIIGNVVSISAIFFIIRRLMNLQTDYTQFLTLGNVVIILMLSSLYGVIVFAMSFSWYRLLIQLTGKKLGFRAVAAVYCKSNIMKYLPGNVFQYVGRNQIAVENDLKHFDVALATVMDIAVNVIGVFIITVICYGKGIQDWLDLLGIINAKYLAAVLAAGILIFLVIVVVLIKSEKVYNKLKAVLSKKNLKVYALCVLVYILLFLCMSCLYIWVLTGILDMHIESGHLMLICGAYLLSWLCGFVIIGAPGGIGIRETVLTVLLGRYFEIELFLVGIVIFRVISILGDLMAVGIAKLISLKNCQRKK